MTTEQRKDLVNYLCSQMDQYDLDCRYNIGDYGFDTVQEFCQVQTDVVENSTDKDVEFYHQILDRFVSIAGMVDKEDMSIWIVDGFFFIWTEEKPRLVFWHSR